MIKVAIDTSVLSGPSRYRGIGRYTTSLLSALKKNNSVFPSEISDNNFPQDSEIIHYPYFDFYFLTLPVIKKKKTVVTIHDCTPLVFPKLFPAGLRGKLKFFIQKLSLKNVGAVITDSFSSKKDIVYFLNVPAEKINVVYLAPAKEFKPIDDAKTLNKVREKFSLPKEFVFYVGDVNYNKNLINLLLACRREKIPLVLAGKQTADKKMSTTNIEEKPLVEFNNLVNDEKDVLRLGFITEEELAVLYSLATVYCQPSFYEGFGLQILEAMACGCPVITSNVSSLPEVAGEAAILVDPSKNEEISQAIKTLRKDNQLRNKMIKMGFAQASNFSWEKTAKQTIQVYEKVIK